MLSRNTTDKTPAVKIEVNVVLGQFLKACSIMLSARLNQRLAFRLASLLASRTASAFFIEAVGIPLYELANIGRGKRWRGALNSASHRWHRQAIRTRDRAWRATWARDRAYSATRVCMNRTVRAFRIASARFFETIGRRVSWRRTFGHRRSRGWFPCVPNLTCHGGATLPVAASTMIVPVMCGCRPQKYL